MNFFIKKEFSSFFLFLFPCFFSLLLFHRKEHGEKQSERKSEYQRPNVENRPAASKTEQVGNKGEGQVPDPGKDSKVKTGDEERGEAVKDGPEGPRDGLDDDLGEP